MNLDQFTRIFEPSVSIFKNGLVINYKKVGSRFLRILSSGSLRAVNFDNKQVDFIIKSDNLYDAERIISNVNTLKYKFTERYVHAPWHSHELGQPSLTNSFIKWKSDKLFFNDVGVSSYTELFFENKNDIIFVVRNPVNRFFSGMTQCIISYFNELKHHDDERNFFKKMTGLSDNLVSELTDAFIEAQFDSVESAKKISSDNILTLFNFFLEHKWDLLVSDIHTEPYLLHFREIIYNIVDISKVKILDLDHLKSFKSEEFFSELRGDNIANAVYKNLREAYRSDSNKPIYDIAMHEYSQNRLVHRSFDRQVSFVDEFLKNEFIIYKDLINSPNFINLQD